MTTGVPDFDAPLELEGFILYAATGEPGRFIYRPDRLEVAPREGRREGPDFLLELVRGESPFLPPQPYGVLDFRLRPLPFSHAALLALRQTHPSAVVSPVLFQQGALRLQRIAGGDTSTPEELAVFEKPVSLAANALDTVRYIHRLSAEAVTLLKGVLQGASLNFTAVAEMELLGLAPRLPVRLAFERLELLAHLDRWAGDGGLLTMDQLVAFWIQPEESLPINPLEGFDAVDTERRARTLADWTAAAFTRFAAAPGELVEPTRQLLVIEEGPETVRWNLADEKLVPRICLLQLNPFDAARQLVVEQGLGTVFKETVVPPLRTGMTAITVATNLPAAPVDVLELGVNLLAPPQPPLRPHVLTDSLALADPQATRRVEWRFSPAEPLAFQYTTYAVVREESQVRHLLGQSTAHEDDYLLLSVDDFPLSFVTIRATSLLMDMAIVRGVCCRPATEGETAVASTFELTADEPVVTLALPVEALPTAELVLEAVALSGAGSISLDAIPARNTTLDLFSLREYGPQRVAIEIDFDDDSSIAALELLPESAQDRPEETVTLAFTPAQPAREWRYFAPSPFQAGYLYRPHHAGEPAAAWSTVQSPFAPLSLRASALASDGGQQ